MLNDLDEPNYLESESCDWFVDDEICKNSPAAFVGRLYYACEEHFEDRKQWLRQL